MADGYLRIGEFGERVGVSPDVLRAWERRYGLLEPDRSPGGYRLYSDTDIARVRQVLALTAQGLSIAEAARLARAGTEPSTDADGPPSQKDATDHELSSGSAVTSGAQAASPTPRLGRLLADALETFDERTAQQTLDELFGRFSTEAVLRDTIMPTLDRIGRRWEAGQLDVAQEHFASNLLRARLLAMARGWGSGSGPMAVLAAPPGEDHDLPLVVFGLTLWRGGWRVTFLGGDTPVPSLRAAIAAVTPDLVVLASVDAARFADVEGPLTEVAGLVRLALAGAGATAGLARRLGAHHLHGDPVSEAERIAGVRSPFADDDRAR